MKKKAVAYNVSLKLIYKECGAASNQSNNIEFYNIFKEGMCIRVDHHNFGFGV